MEVRPVTAPLGSLEHLATRCTTSFPALLAARQRTEAKMGELARDLSQIYLPEETSVVLLGSWGRAEVTGVSDLDWLLVDAKSARAPIGSSEPIPMAQMALDPTFAGTPVAAHLHDLSEIMGRHGADPGSQGTFGTAVHVADLAQKIGLDEDSNQNLTRRMLLALESVPATGAEHHATALRRIITTYLAGRTRDYRPPRFLLNDLIRYWRTIAVDFEGKRREQDDHKWAVRNVKLRTARKVLFMGGLLPVLACRNLPADEMGGYLFDQFSAPATDRIAHAFLSWDAPDEGVRALRAYDAVLGRLADADTRRRLDELAYEHARDDSLFLELRRLGH
ncbi:MAG: hypothetical protein JHD16_11460, partial [Solirubrobacteraceae bacterium]|nr:hypothetical protein [Solirubrobacteraceae bacterium]